MDGLMSRDTIFIEGMLFFGHHGATQEERVLGQHFEVDLEIEANLSMARASDRLADTISYGDVYNTVKSVVEGPSFTLLERVADEVAQRVMAEYHPLSVRVRIGKPRLALRGGVIRSVGVEVYHERE
jgi:dihydroneopterin aldolase